MKFILTKELGRLAKWLRMLGFDAKYSSEGKKSSLIIEALQEGRVVITRSNRLGDYPAGIKKVTIVKDDVQAQIKQVFHELSISPDESLMFSRCTICNDILNKENKADIKDKVPEYVFNTNESFYSCPKCKRIYWQGTHWGNVLDTLKKITAV